MVRNLVDNNINNHSGNHHYDNINFNLTNASPVSSSSSSSLNSDHNSYQHHDHKYQNNGLHRLVGTTAASGASQAASSFSPDAHLGPKNLGPSTNIDFDWPKMDSFYNLISVTFSLAVIFGGLIPFVPQYLKIKESENSDGFSTYGRWLTRDLS